MTFYSNFTGRSVFHTNSHKERLADAVTKDTVEAFKRQTTLNSSEVWVYRVRVTLDFDLPVTFSKPENFYWGFLHDDYEGASVYSIDHIFTSDNGRVWELNIYRSSEEEYHTTDHPEYGIDPDDDEANKEQLRKELTGGRVSLWGDHVKIEVLDRQTASHPNKELLRTETYALGERLGPLMAKYVGTTFDYAQFGAAVLDEVEQFINDRNPKEQAS